MSIRVLLQWWWEASGGAVVLVLVVFLVVVGNVTFSMQSVGRNTMAATWVAMSMPRVLFRLKWRWRWRSAKSYGAKEEEE